MNHYMIRKCIGYQNAEIRSRFTYKKKNTKQKASVTETGIHKQDCQQEGYNTEDSK